MRLEEYFSPEEINILNARAQRIAAPLQEQSQDGRIAAVQVLMSGENYALPIDAITAVYHDVDIIPIPCVPGFVAGVANVRGHLVSVLDLAALLGLEKARRTADGGLVLAEVSGSSVGFCAEMVGGRVELEAARLIPTPTNVSLGHPEYLQGVFADGTILLNMHAILEDQRLIVNDVSN